MGEPPQPGLHMLRLGHRLRERAPREPPYPALPAQQDVHLAVHDGQFGQPRLAQPLQQGRPASKRSP